MAKALLVSLVGKEPKSGAGVNLVLLAIRSGSQWRGEGVRE